MAKFWTFLGNFPCCYWAHFSLLHMGKYLKIKKPPGRTACNNCFQNWKFGLIFFWAKFDNIFVSRWLFMAVSFVRGNLFWANANNFKFRLQPIVSRVAISWRVSMQNNIFLYAWSSLLVWQSNLQTNHIKHSHSGVDPGNHRNVFIFFEACSLHNIFLVYKQMALNPR